MAKREAIGNAVGPFDAYTEVIVDGVGTVGVPAKKVGRAYREEDGQITIEFTDKPAAKPAAKKAAKK